MQFYKINTRRVALLVFVVLFILPVSLISQESLHILDKQPVQTIWHCLNMRIEPKAVEPEKMLSRKFQLICQRFPHIGFINQDIWFKFVLRNLDSNHAKRWLVLENSMLEQVDIYVYDQNKKLQTSYIDGYSRPQLPRQQKSGLPSYKISVPPKSSSIVLIRINTPFAIRAYWSLFKNSAYKEKVLEQAYSFGIYFGIMFVCFFVSTSALFFLKDIGYIWVIPVVIFHSLYLLSDYGFVFYTRDSLGVSASELVLFLELCLRFANIAVTFLFIKLMELSRKNYPFLYKLLIYSNIVYFISGILIWYDLALSTYILLINSFLAGTVLIISLIFLWKKGQRHLRFLLYSVVPTLLIFIFIMFNFLNVEQPVDLEIRLFRYQILFAYLMFVFTVFDKYTTDLHHKENELENKVIEKTMELNKAKHKAEQANLFKENLIRMVAHDMRSPLAAVQASLPLLDPARNLRDEAKKKIHKEVSNAIGGLLNFARYFLNDKKYEESAWQLQMDWHDLQAVVEQAFMQNQAVFSRKNIRLINDVQSILWRFDPEYLYRILGNLFSNAVKYSKPGDRVWVSTQENNTLTIKDEGVGIDPQILELLKQQQPITSLVGTQGETGHGQGLLQALLMVRLQGGDIFIDSEKGKGSKLTIKWPMHFIKNQPKSPE